VNNFNDTANNLEKFLRMLLQIIEKPVVKILQKRYEKKLKKEEEKDQSS